MAWSQWVTPAPVQLSATFNGVQAGQRAMGVYNGWAGFDEGGPTLLALNTSGYPYHNPSWVAPGDLSNDNHTASALQLEPSGGYVLWDAYWLQFVTPVATKAWPLLPAEMGTLRPGVDYDYIPGTTNYVEWAADGGQVVGWTDLNVGYHTARAQQAPGYPPTNEPLMSNGLYTLHLDTATPYWDRSVPGYFETYRASHDGGTPVATVSTAPTFDTSLAPGGPALIGLDPITIPSNASYFYLKVTDSRIPGQVPHPPVDRNATDQVEWCWFRPLNLPVASVQYPQFRYWIPGGFTEVETRPLGWKAAPTPNAGGGPDSVAVNFGSW